MLALGVCTDRYTFPTADAKGVWVLERSFQGEGIEALGVSASDANLSDEIWLTPSSYIQATSYYLATADAPEKHERLKSLPTVFDATGVPRLLKGIGTR